MNIRAMVTISLGLAICALPLGGQAFQSLSTTEDGSVLYFSSVTRQKGTDQTVHSKVFRWDATGGVRVVAEVHDEAGNDCYGSSFYQLLAPQVSSDGTVLAYTENRPAGFVRLCGIEETNQGVIQLPGREVKLDGNVAISRNGRYAITTPFAAVADNYHIVTDLTTGVSNAVAGAFTGGLTALPMKAPF